MTQMTFKFKCSGMHLRWYVCVPGISRLSSKDGKALSDPEVLRTLTSSVSSALDEAAQALHRMRDSQGQPMISDGSVKYIMAIFILF